ncbi:MAG: ADOP family duplicated permease [Gemmatimonadaceae bacterium]
MSIIESLGNLVHRLQRALGRTKFETQLDDELRFHVEAESADLVRRGVEPTEARRQALAALGGMDRWRDEARETRATSSLETLMRDVRLALRSLRRSPSYTLPVLVTLALGIGAMASIATLAYDVLFRPLPYRDPGALVAVFERNVPRKRDHNVVSAVAVEAWRQRSRTLDSVSMLMPSSKVWQSDAGAERISGAEVSPSLFELLGRRPALGPGFSSTAVNEVIVSYNFWIRRLSADSSVIGKSIRLDGQPVTLVGVMPADFVPLRFGWMGDQELWLPLVLTQQHRAWGRFLLVAARLKPGATLTTASRELESIHAQLRSEGAIDEGWDSQVIPLAEEITGNVRPAFLALLVACALLLAMVLTNTTLLTIAHAERRASDRALRAVLGATRGRLMAERLVTTVLLAGGGALLGIALAMWAIPALAAFLPDGVPRMANVHFGGVAVITGVGTGLLAALLLAIVPGFSQGGDAGSALHGGSRLTRGTHTSWVVIGEAATAVVLTLFAGLTLRSFDRLSSVDYGFNAQRLIAFRVGFDGPGISTATAVATSKAFLGRLRVIPGVLSVGRTSVRPFYEGGTATTITPVGWGDKDRSAFPTADVRFVDAEYFQTLGLTPMSGRLFSGSERSGGPIRAVVNEAFGKKLWPGEGAGLVGRTFDVRVNGTPSPEIIGVVRDVRLVSPREDTRPTVYLFVEQMSAGEEYDVLVRTSVDESAVLPQIREVLRSVAAATPIYRVESMQRTVDQTIARERVTAQLLLFFAVAALLLVAVGVYGLFAGEVTRRRREIGVRMALGETAGGVVRAMLTRALVRTTIGVLGGVVVGFMASRLLQAVLFGIAPSDPLSYVGAGIVVIVTAISATLVPAMHASSVAPSEALRAE